MRFVFVAVSTRPYDIRLMQGLSSAIEAAGHQVKVLVPAAYTLENIGPTDISFAVNCPRPEWLPADVLHISWVQDFLPNARPYYGENKKKNDIVYVLTNPDAQGVEAQYVDGALLTGVDAKLLTVGREQPTIDLSICGYVPPPLGNMIFPDIHPWPDKTNYGVFCCKELERMYTPLCGELRCVDYYMELRAAFFARLHGFYKESLIESTWARISHLVGHWTMDYPRGLDRIKLATLALQASDNCVFQGINWELHSELRGKTRSHTDNEGDLHRFYQHSRINLHTNCDGYGPHSRVLEAMAVGGFIMTHTVKWPEKGGCMDDFFEPGRHFGEFTPKTFVEEAKSWLANTEARERAIVECKGLIESSHLWKHRAAQLLNDLGL